MDKEVELLEWIEILQRYEGIIIVEGVKDKRALEKLGINNVHPLSGKPLFKVIEDISQKTKRAIILTDLDKEGKKLYGTLNSGLRKHGVTIDNRFREFLFTTRFRQIEGLTVCNPDPERP
jgi:5S rRNA maturation endonuclease (ribonuclease M5)